MPVYVSLQGTNVSSYIFTSKFMSPWINPNLKVLFWEIVDRIIHIFTARSKLVLPFMENVLMFRAGYMIWDTCQYVRDENLSKSGGRLSIYYLHGFFIIFWKLNIFYHITFYPISKYWENLIIFFLSYFFIFKLSYHIFYHILSFQIW